MKKNLIIMLIPTTLIGCPSEYDFHTVKGDIEELRFVDCQDWDCDHIVQVSSSELMACYGWDGSNWISPPPGFFGDCDPTAGPYCESIPEVRHGNFAFRANNNCGCEEFNELAESACCMEGVEGEDVSSCCYSNTEGAELETDLKAFWEADGLPPEVDILDSDCGIIAQTFTECSPANGVGPDELTLDCDVLAVGEGVNGADYLLEVDPSLSYLTINIFGVGQDTVELSGGGVAGTDPSTSFLFGIVDTEEAGTLGTDIYDDWRFWFTNDISLSVQTGDFVVPAGQDYAFNGRGLDNGMWAKALFEPQSNATGHFYVDSWYLDYHASNSQGSVTVRLEGDLVGISIP